MRGLQSYLGKHGIGGKYMGTRSTTKIYRNGELILALYKQFDGYIEGGWGEDLKKFFKSGKFVNGISLAETSPVIFNGIEDFALQLVVEFKQGSGELYATTAEDSQNYNYCIDYIDGKKIIDKETGEVSFIPDKIIIECKEEKSYYEEIQVGFLK